MRAVPPGRAAGGSATASHCACCWASAGRANSSSAVPPRNAARQPATLLRISTTLLRLDYRLFEGREPQLFLDPLVHLAFRKFLGHPDCVLDGLGVGASVADDAYSAYSQQRRAAVLRIIDASLETTERLLGEQCADAAADGRFQRFAQQMLHQVHQAFAHLERHV